MAATILLITDAPEADRLGRTLQRIWGRDLRLLSDAIGTGTPEAQPEAQIARARPDVLVLGAGQQLDAVLPRYLEATRRICPRCTVVLLCDPPFAAQAARLRPDLLLQRPLTGAALQGLLAELAKGLRDNERWQPAAAAQQVALQRADDLFADPLALPAEVPRPAAPALTDRGRAPKAGYLAPRTRSAG